MIDPITTLAFSMQSSPGIYALLLGSGISRPARIPTGWEITLDLIKKLAATSGEECTPSPEEWYRTKFGKAPDYSELLDSLGKGQAERQMLLRGYFERSKDEPDEGVKQPTIAHRSIAALVAQGFIRVIITTNFDHLMETALREAGIEPTVISTQDHVKGSLPLIHTKCCLLKVNGDYMDTRIRNTEEELASYESEFDSLLDRIFDEFGLVVCGWSALWDGALRNALERTPTRRFSSYWIARGEIGSTAQGLISRRGMQIVKDRDADSFFSALQEQVKSLQEYSRPHPLSAEAAVASLKRYLEKDEFRIRLADLVSSEVDKVLEATTGPNFAFSRTPIPDKASVTARFLGYETACGTILPMSVAGGYWAKAVHLPVWQRALERLSTRRGEGGFELWIHLQKFPAVLFFYGLGMSALNAGQLEIVGRLFSLKVKGTRTREYLPAVQVLNTWETTKDIKFSDSLLEGFNGHTPVSFWMCKQMEKYFAKFVDNKDQYVALFDEFEILVALSNIYQRNDPGDKVYAPHGAYSCRNVIRDRFLQDIRISISKQGANSPFVMSGIFGNSSDGCGENLRKLEAIVKALKWDFFFGE